MKQRYNDLTEDLCCDSVRNYFSGKWAREECLQAAEEYAGIPRRELLKELREGKTALKEEVIKNIGYEMFTRLTRLLQGKRNALELFPVIVRPRRDGMNGKMRDITLCCIFHQLFGHLLILGLKPLLRAHLLPFQFASIPKRGQTGLKKYVMRKLRKKSLNIRCAQKTDVVHAYASTNYTLIIQFIQKEIPSAKWIIAVLSELAKMSPSGCLIIGGYADAWLFNYMMSYAMRYAKEQSKVRREKKTPLIKSIVSFMDDFGFLGSRLADVKRDIKLVNEFLKRQMNLQIKNGKETRFVSIAEEKRRKKETSAAKRKCPFFDVAGYQMSFGHVSIRKQIFKRVRRTFLRAFVELVTTFTICIQRARKVVAHFGFFKQTNSKKIRRKLQADYIHAAARRIISHYQKIKNAEA